MAKWQEIFVVQDLIRNAAIMNDLVDVAAWTLRDIDAQTGEQIQIKELIDTRTGQPMLPTVPPPERAEFGQTIFRDASVAELKDRGKRLCQNALGYHVTINTFLSKIDRTIAERGLAALGADLAILESDIADMQEECYHIINTLPTTVAAKEALVAVAEHIDANVPKLILVRRSWCLGL